jgi:ATP synthase protein I
VNDKVNAHRPKTFSRAIGFKAARKRWMQRRGNRSLGFGLGMLGLIGWSVALPTLIGALLGIWIDHHFTSMYSWTLTLLVGGLILGCALVWHWVSQEERKIGKDARRIDE